MRFKGADLLREDPAVVNDHVRGRAITFIPQDPYTSFSPVFPVHTQIMDLMKWKSPRAGNGGGTRSPFRRYPRERYRADRETVLEMLRAVQIPEPARALRRLPHEFSGGQRQRLMIAMALLPQPDLIIADEPTTALDVTIQAQILRLLRQLVKERGVSVLFTTHDLGTAHEICDRVVVMYAGQEMEAAPADAFFARPAHPYTRRLLASVPSPGGEIRDIPGEVPSLIAPPPGCRFHPRCDYATPECRQGRPALRALALGPRRALPPSRRRAGRSRRVSVPGAPLLEIVDLVRYFPVRNAFGRRTGWIRAVDGLSLAVWPGETLGLVGESGCGKSTLGKTVMGIYTPTAGDIRFAGREIGRLPTRERRAIAKDLQYVYQDPGASLDPRWKVVHSLHEPLKIHTRLSRAERERQVRAILASVGLPDAHLDLYPHELSGGQQRRVGLARILTLRPQMVILDEPTSGLDVSVQASVLKLLRSPQETFALTYVFISHDLAVVRAMCARIAVMYLGTIVELGETAAVFEDPRHPYTRSLLAAVPRIGGRRVSLDFVLEGEPPNPRDVPSGCRFRTRCPLAQDICAVETPPLRELEGRSVACHFA